MSKKQRDSLYAEVQKHQKSQECVGSSGTTALSLPREDGGCGSGADDGEEGLSRSYSSGGSTSTLSDLDDIATLPDLFDLPLTPEEASEYCSLELLGGGGASTGNTSNSSSSSSASSSSQNSPQQTAMDTADSCGSQLLLTHSLLGRRRSLLDHLPDDCSVTDLGETENKNRATDFPICPLLLNSKSKRKLPWFLNKWLDLPSKNEIKGKKLLRGHLTGSSSLVSLFYFNSFILVYHVFLTLAFMIQAGNESKENQNWSVIGHRTAYISLFHHLIYWNWILVNV